MLPGDWHTTEDIDHFLTRAGDFLRSRPAEHTTALTAIGRLRTGGADGVRGALFGWLEQEGEVRAACYRPAARRLGLTPIPPGQADALADHLAELHRPLSGVVADHGSATAFAEAWRRRTGAVPAADWRARLHRLDVLAPPGPVPAGRGRAAGTRDHGHVVRWCREFCVEVGEEVSVNAVDAGAWAATRFADKHFTYWETPDGAPVSLAGSTPMVAGMVRIDPVYTPARLRGRGYAGAVTVEAVRAALAAGATDVVLYTDPDDPTSNALYRRIGFVPLADWTGYGFS